MPLCASGLSVGRYPKTCFDFCRNTQVLTITPKFSRQHKLSCCNHPMFCGVTTSNNKEYAGKIWKQKRSKKCVDIAQSKDYNVLAHRFLDGGIAQLARAFGSYPGGRWFKSCCRYHVRANSLHLSNANPSYWVSRWAKGSPTQFFINQIWPVGQAVKTPAFHAGNRGSSPLRVTIPIESLIQWGSLFIRHPRSAKPPCGNSATLRFTADSRRRLGGYSKGDKSPFEGAQREAQNRFRRSEVRHESPTGHQSSSFKKISRKSFGWI